jgi:hypothetical protein
MVVQVAVPQVVVIQLLARELQARATTVDLMLAVITQAAVAAQVGQVLLTPVMVDPVNLIRYLV